MNPCHGLLRLRAAEAKGWQPLAPHLRARLNQIDQRVRSWLPWICRQIAGRVMTYTPCIACRLLTEGISSRRSVSSAWHREMVRLINEVRKDRFTLDTLFRADRALRRMEGGR